MLRCSSRVLISLNGHEMFIVLAQYSSEYIEQSRAELGISKSSPPMRVFGPYDINNAEKLETFCIHVRVLLAHVAHFENGGKDAFHTF